MRRYDSGAHFSCLDAYLSALELAEIETAMMPDG
jgi:hypothetical protein